MTEPFEQEQSSGQKYVNESLVIDDSIEENEIKDIWNELLLKYVGCMVKDYIHLQKSPPNPSTFFVDL